MDSLLLNTELLVTRSLALRQQISPHFLFNGLNNICSLVDEDASKAQGLLRNISELLRFNMNVEQAIAVSVEDELHFLEKYISVSELQYENRLRYSQKVDSECMSYFIPVLAIQTLVENAIKHGLNDAPKACRIELDIIDSGTFVEVSVVNDGRIKREGANKIGGPESIAMDNTRCKQKGESGLGLRNLRERIEIFFGSSATLHLDQDGEKVRVILRFPKKRHGRSVASNNLSMMK